MKHYPFIGHVLLAASIAAPLRVFAPVLADSAQFIDAQAAAQQAGSREGGVGSLQSAASVGDIFPLRSAGVSAVQTMPGNRIDSVDVATH
ncbi:hypothetical protein NDK50_12665 [Paraburkholderia bryophila]|uniref:hypothetical protein n=1 Tax=Paraburkholderia bryophila TaxID=420952 RepID=UPI002349F2FE|nr:hypothetical protein [Paraburkholderia bryophila]WCM18317.1 hypothetical protein NDK50_12665 [Paraburkholderia bryophila]